MKSIQLFVGLMLLLISCNTYEDGPGVSLRSKKARAINVWVLSRAFEDGFDKTDQYKTTFVNYKLELKADDNYVLSYRYQNAINYEEKGKWKFSNDKLNIVFTPVNSSQENAWKILRLKNHEARVIANIDGKLVELHLED